MPQPHKVEGQTFVASLGSALSWKLLERAAGLAKHIVIAGAFGLAASLDVFYLNMAIFGVLVFSWGNLLDVLAIPALVAHRCAGRSIAFRDLARALFTSTLIFGIAIAALIFVSRSLLPLCLPGLDQNRREMMSRSLTWFLPAIIVLVPLRCIGGIYRAQRLFSKYFQGEAVIALVALLFLILFHNSPNALFWTYSVGVVAAFLYLFVPAQKRFGLLGSPIHTELPLLCRQAPGLLALQGMQYMYQLTDRFFVSYLPAGSVGALAYGWTLTAVLPGLLWLQASFITIFAERRSRGDAGSSVLNDVISFSTLITVPIMIAQLSWGLPIVRLLLQRAHFSPADTALTAAALVGYAPALLAIVLLPILDQVFQVIRQVGIMVRRLVYGVVANILLNILFTFYWHLGVQGIALATTISYLLMFLWALKAVDNAGIHIAWKRHSCTVLFLIGLCTTFVYILSQLNTPIIPAIILYAAATASLILLIPGHQGGLVRQHLRPVVATLMVR